MNPSESDRRPTPPGPIDGGADRVAAMENLLHSLEGVEAVRVIPGVNGGLDEIHVLSESGLEPKKVVRNVESALLAEAGVQIDHRIVSVAQRRDELPEVSEEALVDSRDGGGEGRLALREVHIERRTGHKITCTVRLGGRRSYEGRAAGTDHRKIRLEVVGKAVLDALREVTDGGEETLVLDGVETVDSFGGRVVLALIHAMKGRRAVPLVGAALVEDSPEESAVLAVLDATNRWMGRV